AQYRKVEHLQEMSCGFFLSPKYIFTNYYLKFLFFSVYAHNHGLNSIKLAKVAMKLTAMGQFLVLIAIFTHAVICSSYGNYTDRLSLLEFKKAISLDPHQALTSWNDSTHFCRWEGVLCSVKNPSRVTSLNLTNRGLVGQISPSLGNLTFLKILVLSTNSFSGEIPMPLGHLHRLQTLSLQNNTLQGRIPSLANCSKLTELLLGNNQLTGQIPVDLPQCLENLDLTTNNLTGTIPDSVANITTLQLFSCAMNKIEGNIPNEFANLLGLQILRVSINEMSGQFPQPIMNLSNLIKLSIALNKFSGVVPSSIGNSLPDLQVIVLDGNLFHGHIPSSLTNASKLKYIDIAENKFTGTVPISFGKLSKLSWLNLQLNKLQASSKQDWKFMDSLANCTELSAFSVANNYLTGQVPNSVGNLSSQLQGLYLGGNQLSGNFPSGIANLHNLVIVSLFQNNFTSVLPEWLGTLNSLQVVQLSDNFFTGLIPSSFSNLSQLTNLVLEWNQLNGHIPPSLGNLQVLQALLISSNNLHGTIPKEIFTIPTLVRISLSFNSLHAPLHADIGNAKQLTYLEISSNNLSGEIPSTLGDCESLEIIELGHNFFSGSIPSFLGNISNLQILNLSHNNLTGSIPVALSGLQFLEQLDLSFNHLKGEVPTKGIFKNATALWINGNQGLCGGPLGLHLLACPIMQSNSAKRKLSVIRKIIIPVAIVMVFAAAFAVWLSWRRKQKKKTISLPSLGRLPRISYGDLVRATDSFARSNLIGQGRYGSVYQGKLSHDGKAVAIKVFSLETRGAQKSFIAECSALRNVRHRNLVPILTACSSIDSSGNDFKALVYEFMPRGDLHNLLYSTQDSEGFSCLNYISLAQRLSIMADVSEALAYLHHNHQGTIVHCDLKPRNILLDDDMVAHVGDFGLARFKSDTTSLSPVDSTSTSSAAIKGTIGYIAPEYAAGGQASTAADVYSFGVVLIEIFTRRSPTDDMFKDGMTIAKLTEINFPENVLQIVDPQLLQELDQREDIPMTIRDSGAQILQYVLGIGLCCTKTSPGERISMQESLTRFEPRLAMTMMDGTTRVLVKLLLMLMAAFGTQRVAICASLYGNETDRQSLIAFKEAISHDPQQALLSWNDSTHFCNWEGVLCRVKSSPPRVTSLNLMNRALAGQISPAIGNLTFLRRLVLSKNVFTGEIPESLGRLRSLQILVLSDNTLQGITPPFANSSSLKDLLLSRNVLVGQFPDLPYHLQRLELEYNDLTGNIPASLANITTLDTFSCEGNNNKGNIPDELGRLPGLKFLAADENQLAGFIPSSLSNLSQLVSLFLDSNKFGGHLHPSLGNLRMLNTLSISENFLQGMIPKEIFGIPTIIQINLSSNNLDGQLPKEVGNAEQLVNFLLSSNKLSGDIPNTLGNCESLQHVKLDQNNFSGTIPTSLGNLSTLQVLNLSRNNLTGPIPVSLGSLELLEQLDLSFNHLTDALEYLHHNNSQGTIVHCDLKPSNILFDDDMTAHIGDFGLARFKADSTASSFADLISACSIAIKGTIGYVAPGCAAVARFQIQPPEMFTALE
ncbi:putative LRR receptor-like serine/threonine-protein kinase, partial [Dichanthelium oligosanthes]